jgi:hypothetical protein
LLGAYMCVHVYTHAITRTQDIYKYGHTHTRAHTRGVIDQVIDLSVKTCQYRAVTDSSLVPIKQWREWIALFTAGVPLFPEESMIDQSATEARLPHEQDVQVSVCRGRVCVCEREREHVITHVAEMPHAHNTHTDTCTHPKTCGTPY